MNMKTKLFFFVLAILVSSISVGAVEEVEIKYQNDIPVNVVWSKQEEGYNKIYTHYVVKDGAKIIRSKKNLTTNDLDQTNFPLFKKEFYKLNGPYEEYHKNGMIRVSGNHKDGKKVGEWQYYPKDNNKYDEFYIEVYNDDGKKIKHVKLTPEQIKKLKEEEEIYMKKNIDLIPVKENVIH